jgi:hypothetical protein
VRVVQLRLLLLLLLLLFLPLFLSWLAGLVSDISKRTVSLRLGTKDGSMFLCVSVKCLLRNHECLSDWFCGVQVWNIAKTLSTIYTDLYLDMIPVTASEIYCETIGAWKDSIGFCCEQQCCCSHRSRNTSPYTINCEFECDLGRDKESFSASEGRTASCCRTCPLSPMTKNASALGYQLQLYPESYDLDQEEFIGSIFGNSSYHRVQD